VLIFLPEAAIGLRFAFSDSKSEACGVGVNMNGVGLASNEAYSLNEAIRFHCTVGRSAFQFSRVCSSEGDAATADR